MKKDPDVHYLPNLLCYLLHKEKNGLVCYKFHQTCDGWTAVLKCKITGIEYVLTLNSIASTVTVEKPLTYLNVIKEFEK